MNKLLDVNNISCLYRSSDSGSPIVNNLSFSLEQGEIGCLLGSSGCGKTTILRSIAGFQSISSGSIQLKDQLLSGDQHHLAPEKRHVGMVFQDYALFPHLSVSDNITFGLNKKPAFEREATCREMLALVKLEGLGHRFPHELSGGQQQRVALARALAPIPDLLLLDEPLSSLDTELRRNLALEVRDILKSRGVSAILVTHDQEEAFAFADKVGVLHQGNLEQWDCPFKLYHEPKTHYVASFIGQGVFLPGFIRNDNVIETELGMLSSQNHLSWEVGHAVEVLLRPDDIILDNHSPYKAKVMHKVFTGTSTLYTLMLPTGTDLEAALPSHHNFEVGTEITVSTAVEHLITLSIPNKKTA